MGTDLTRRRFLARGSGALAAAWATGSGLGVTRARAAAPGTASYAVKGLKEPGEILVDHWGIPHLYARSQPDVFFMQGFNVARDRLWQIDLWRRRGLGRLSAAFGPSYVDQDRATRLFLYRGDIQREWDAYGPDSEAIATAFTSGVNAYIDLVEQGTVPLPVEFEAMDYAPERWGVEDFVRVRSHGLVSNVSDEVTRALVLRDFGREAERMRQRLRPPEPLRVPEGLDLDKIPDDVLDVYVLATKPVEFGTDEATAGAAALREHVRVLTNVGSNNWTVSPQRTASGRPLLANDPHRAQGVPSLRYIAHLVAPGLDVIGGGEPALPGISIGHNDRIAFGLTIFDIDQEDLYVYDTNPADPSQYRYKGGWEPMRVEHESIPVKGEASREVTLKFTRHGAVVREDPAKHTAFAIRSVWFEPGTSAYFASIGYMRARNWREFKQAMRRWRAPSENQVFADTRGHIGWKPGGLAPVRPNWDGLLPVPGDGRYEWEGFLDPSKLPVKHDPRKGWFATANAYNVPRDYPIRRRKLGFEWASPFRVHRISRVLRRDPNLTRRKSQNLQGDHRSLPAQRLVPLLRHVGAHGGEAERAVRLLERWDRMVEADSAAAALFEVWWNLELRHAVLRTVLGSERAVEAVEPGDPTVILDLLEHPDRRLGPAPRAARDRILRASLGRAVRRTEALLGRDWGRWRWGALHVARFDHPLSPVVSASLRRRLNVGPVPVGGDSDTVGNTSYGGPRPQGEAETRAYFEVSGGASYRETIDVGRWDRSWTMNNPGQSGDPSSPHYRDLIRRWAANEPIPMLYSRRRVRQAAEQRIALRPAVPG